MINETMYGLGSKSSVIRELFAYGLERKKVVGEDKVYDFSLGNPSIPAPHEVKDALLKLLEEPAEVLHSYSPASGDPKAKQMLAQWVLRPLSISAFMPSPIQGMSLSPLHRSSRNTRFGWKMQGQSCSLLRLIQRVFR